MGRKETAELIRDYLTDWSKSRGVVDAANLKYAHQPLPDQSDGLPLSTSILDARVNAILRPLRDNNLLHQVIGKFQVERVWVAVKVNRPRRLQQGTLPYTLRLIPSTQQTAAATELFNKERGLNLSKEEVRGILQKPLGHLMRSSYDSAVACGYLSTMVRIRGLEDSRNAPPKRDKQNEEELTRKDLLNTVYRALDTTGEGQFELNVPIHVWGACYACVRALLPMRDRHHIISFYCDVIPSLASQLRRTVQEAMVADVEQRVGQAPFGHLYEIPSLVQAAFPMPNWKFARRSDGSHSMKFEESPGSRFWKIDFIRHDAEQKGLSQEIEGALARFAPLIPEPQPGLLPYVSRATLLAKQVLAIRRTIPEGEVVWRHLAPYARQGVFSGVLYDGKRRHQDGTIRWSFRIEAERDELLAVVFLSALAQAIHRPRAGRLSPKAAALLRKWLLNPKANIGEDFQKRKSSNQRGYGDFIWPSWNEIRELDASAIELSWFEVIASRHFFAEALAEFNMPENERHDVREEASRLIATLRTTVRSPHY